MIGKCLKRRPTWRLAPYLAITAGLLSAGRLLAQVVQDAAASPNRNQCLQWDEAYGQIVLFGMIGAAIVALVLGLTIGFMVGRQWWWAASPRVRIWIASLLIVFPILEFVVIVWPRVFGFGRLLYAPIDPRYADCQSMSFGGHGILGIIGKGVAAYGQWQWISALLLAACAIGGLLAWIISEALVSSSGMASVAKGGDA
jgi:sorbitol-specific phosphotransferase system component IIC